MQLFKYSETRGLPVVSASDGKKPGVVKDILVNPEERTVAALLLERKGMEFTRRFILFGDILGIGKDAVTVSSSDSVSCDTAKWRESWVSAGSTLIGMHVFEKLGQEVGSIADIVFDCGTGRIESTEISDGLLQDILQGRHTLPLLGRVEFGEENIIVEKEAVEEMVNNGRGIKNIIFRQFI